MLRNDKLPCISSSHPEVKLAMALFQNKKIDPADLFIVEGSWAYEKLVRAGLRVRTLLLCPELIRDKTEYELIMKLRDIADHTYRISEKVSRRISDRDDPEGCFLLCHLPECSLSRIELRENNLIIILDGLEKPGNIGTIIRTADAAGADAVVVCNQKVKLTHQRLVKASMGSSFIMPVIAAGMPEILQWLKKNGFRVFLTDLKATQNCYETDYAGRVAIVAGNEIRGISEEWNRYACERVIIPMFGGADSLNVGFAATLVVYEAAMRQRNLVKR